MMDVMKQGGFCYEADNKRVVAFFAAMGLMVSGLSLNEPASADAKAKAKVKSVTIKNVKKKLTLKKEILSN